MRRFVSSSVVAGSVGRFSTSALVRSSTLGRGCLAASYATKGGTHRTAETELRSYFEKEVELLNEDNEAQNDIASQRAELDGWAKRFQYTVNIGQEEIVATKRDPVLNADVTVKIDPQVDYSGAPENEAIEREEADSLGDVHLNVEVKKANEAMSVYGVISDSVLSIAEVVFLDKDGKDHSTYDVQRLDEEGQEKFRLYLSSLGINDTFIPAVYSAVQLHDEEGYHKWVHDVLSFSKQ